jgi:hypothetical protein
VSILRSCHFSQHINSDELDVKREMTWAISLLDLMVCIGRVLCCSMSSCMWHLGAHRYDGVGVRNARVPVMQRNVKTRLLLMVIMPGWLSQSDRFNPIFNSNTITRIRILHTNPKMVSLHIPH